MDDIPEPGPVLRCKSMRELLKPSSNLTSHEQTNDKTTDNLKTKKPRSLLCPGEQCGDTFKCSSQLYDHLRDVHLIELNGNENQIDSMIEKLSSGNSFEHVQDSDGEEEESEVFSSKRLRLDETYYHNVIKHFKTKYLNRRHNDDSLYVNMWVDKMSSLGEDNPVLFYKSEGIQSEFFQLEDFVLFLMTKAQAKQLKKFGCEKICVDSTNGTNKFDIQICTVMAVNELGSGGPVAYCFHNRFNEHLLTFFFEHLKKIVGPICTSMFFTGKDPEYYNAWAKVMGEPKHNLMSSWQVDREWERNLIKIKGAQEKKADVYNQLGILLNENASKRFQKAMTSLLNNLLEDTETKEFGEYFLEQYASCSKCWAYCYYKDLAKVPNYLDELYKISKCINEEGKRNHPLDKTIDAVLKVAKAGLFKFVKVLKKFKKGKK